MGMDNGMRVMPIAVQQMQVFRKRFPLLEIGMRMEKMKLVHGKMENGLSTSIAIISGMDVLLFVTTLNKKTQKVSF